MRIAYLDAFAGASGDMLIGACVHAGAPLELLEGVLASLQIGATLHKEEVDRSGIHSVKVHVLEGGEIAESRNRPHGHLDHGHSHEHAHGYPDEGRSLEAIRRLIANSALEKQVKTFAIQTFECLGAAESKIHRVPIESVHFHEVGAVDAIADIVLVAAAVSFLHIDRWHCSALNLGSGTVECAHGRYPVPAPATAELLRGVPTYSSGPAMELVTPTGAALIRALDCKFGPLPGMRVESIGYGAGTKILRGSRMCCV